MHIIKVIYGLFVSAMLFYQKLTVDLTYYSFEINPYNPCVANRQLEGSQMTIFWHIDDLKVSHASYTIVDEFIEWIKPSYGIVGEEKTADGEVHNYLGMMLDYASKGQVSVVRIDYVKSMIKNFPSGC